MSDLVLEEGEWILPCCEALSEVFTGCNIIGIPCVGQEVIEFKLLSSLSVMLTYLSFLLPFSGSKLLDPGAPPGAWRRGDPGPGRHPL